MDLLAIERLPIWYFEFAGGRRLLSALRRCGGLASDGPRPLNSTATQPMLFIRRQLSAWSITWLLCQVASLCALLPPECCAAHAAAAESSEECHKAPGADAQCPMHDAAGQPCPMHQADGAGLADRACSMRGLCDGPAVALGSLFAIPGILLEPSSDHVDLSASALTIDVAYLRSAPLSFDTPPPRA